jgi:hypothetical protein
MKIPYKFITIREMGELALNGYELSTDADEQAVHITRRWPKTETIQGNEAESPRVGIDFIGDAI